VYVCVVVCRRRIIACITQCDMSEVPSKKCLASLYVVYTQSGNIELNQMVSILIVLYQMPWLIMVTLKLYIDQIIFLPNNHRRNSFNIRFNYILKQIHP
jgi:hypothetical protein